MFSKSLMLLCASMFLAYAGQAILTPIIPIYVNRLGGSTSVAGFALLAFAAPSFLVRPILGPMADRIGHAVMLTFGVISLALAGLTFFIPSLIALFIGSAARGLAWGALNIGGYAHLATAAPPDRRGEATGYFYSAITGAFVVFPALGLWLMNGGGGPVAVFATSFAVTAVAIPIALRMRRRELADRRAAPPEPETASAPARASALNRGIVIAMVLSLCQTLPAPAIAAFLPLFAQKEGLGDVSMYYIVSGILIVLMRFVLGKRADSLGQGTLIAVGFVAQTIGLIMIWRGHTLPIVLVGAIIASIGPGLIGAATTTLAMDAAPPERRGQAMAIFTMTFQIGAGLGSVFSGMLADLLGVRDMYLGSLAISLIGTIFLVAVWKTMPRPVR
ncbi:MAG: MFS transporter [Phenylobacterium sp.]|uniref:MFS transporter n=1 Tax=Phenylobacterium sp. TaxID=1871053 RepID=UPI002734060E|nr:MFS transporter [Phenylobacterium sp.]MDP3174866.1 MFS transporter [Phenylobacterium sp.]